MKAPRIKKLADGGDVPKFKTKAEHDKYYKDLGYLEAPINAAGGKSTNALYNPKQYGYDPSAAKWSALTPDASVTGWGGTSTGPKPEHLYSFTPEATSFIPSTAPKGIEETGRKALLNGNPNYQSFQYADESGQYGNATQKHFDKTTGKEINPSVSFGKSGEYIPQFLAKGGIVKQLKGYKYGGTTEDDIRQTNTTNAGIGLAGQLGSMGGQFATSKAMNEDGTINQNQAALGGALQGGAKGLAQGANPALMAATGGLSAPIGALAGAGIGGVAKYVGAKNVNEDISYGQKQAEYDKIRGEQQNKFDSALNQQMLEREEGMKHGGVVKGPGGPKDDKVKAKILPGSFIVPAEKVSLLKSKVNVTKKKANLNQSQGTDVKLSDGEWVLDPSEKEEIISELGEEFLEALAPNAEHEDENFREGGLTPYKAKKMLEDGYAHKTPLTDKQRGYMGLIASGYKCGGMVKGYKEGGEVEGETESASIENPSDKFEKLKQEVEASLQKAYPNQKVEVIYKGDKRNISQQKTNLKKGASKSAVSLHQLGGARDFNIKIDGRVLGNNKEDIKVYKEHLWKNAEKTGLYHLKEGKGNFGDTDPYHIGLVEEKGDGTAFKELIAKYPSLKDSDSVKATIKDIQEYKKKNPNDKTYDIITNALTVDEKPIKKAPIIAKEKPVDFVKSESDKLTQERNKLEDNTKLEKRKEEHLDYAKAVKRASERVNMYKKMYDDYDKVNSGGSPIFAPSVAQKSSAIRAKKELLDKYIEEKKNFDNVSYAYKKSQSDIDNWGKEDGSKVAEVKKQNQNTIPVKSGAGIEKINNQNNQADSGGISQALRESLKFTPPTGETSDTEVPVKETVKETFYPTLLNETAQKGAKDYADQQLAEQAQQAKNQQMLGKGLGLLGDGIQGVGNYAIPFQQYKMGQKFLAQTGPRPKDKIDPEFQNVVTKAQANAQFGYTPQEQSLLDQQNLNALRAGQGAAQNFSGGSGAVGYNLTRDAANQYVGRGLKNLIGGNQIQAQKQQIANDLIGQKSDMNRRLFNDSMTAWKENQAAGSNLVGMGLQNLLGANRLNKEYAFQNKMANNSNPYSDSYANSLINYNG